MSDSLEINDDETTLELLTVLESVSSECVAPGLLTVVPKNALGTRKKK